MKRLLAFSILALLALCGMADAQATFNKRAVISISSSGSNQVVAAVANQRIAIYGIDLSCATSTTVQMLDGSTPLSGAMTLTSYSKPLTATGPYWVGTAGNAFNIGLGAAVSCAGTLWYTQGP